MPYELILTERLDGCALITLNRPEKLNALSFRLMSELDEALTRIDAELGSVAEVHTLVGFVRASKRGFIR